jgi:hypothetical protein
VAVFREPEREISVWRRFRDGADGFVSIERDGLKGVRAVGNAESMVELFLDLIPELPDELTVEIDDWREGRRWRGETIGQGDLLASLYPLRLPLAASGGVELTLLAPQRQLTLSAHLELLAWSQTDQWAFLLARAGLVERDAVRGRLWRPERGRFASAPALIEPLERLVRALTLVAV